MNHNSSNKHQGCGSGMYGCPIGELINQVRSTFGSESEFRQHIRNSKVEFLKAIRSIIDKKIQDLEQSSKISERRATKVQVD
ncbi:hypothetical protein [Thermodesulforhabdus norvegica]|uniref:Uncharacterized protein n=1 Tax=Thermodesulforhabdus norvegica TaxID=39841 RepID=A0A1I4U7R4_9BACT|nr:hypothetical protein [Thermodesulforhabdus norvegica]SFM85028.1 hypothetical protein SAMN05660836_01691 [Thermodesulforhabdus norvegica]